MVSYHRKANLATLVDSQEFAHGLRDGDSPVLAYEYGFHYFYPTSCVMMEEYSRDAGRSFRHRIELIVQNLFQRIGALRREGI
jgi:hypothetical protein